METFFFPGAGPLGPGLETFLVEWKRRSMYRAMVDCATLKPS